MMKIKDAKQAYSAQLDVLWNKKRTLTKLLKEQEEGGAAAAETDRVEISKELSKTDAEYEAVRSVMESINERDAAIQNAEFARQQGEAAAEQAEELSKIMEVYRRIASGAKVPAEDEKKLMDFSYKLYMAAKTAAMLAERNDKEYDSLWEDEEEEEEKSPSEIAGDTEISVPAPEAVAAGAAEAEAAEAPQPEMA